MKNKLFNSFIYNIILLTYPAMTAKITELIDITQIPVDIRLVGFIIFRQQKPDNWQCLLIKTIDNYYHFPSGDNHEKRTQLENAYHSIKQETGIEPVQLIVLSDYCLLESYIYYTSDQFACYFVAIFNSKSEYNGINWIDIDMAKNLLVKSDIWRKELLEKFKIKLLN